MRELGAGDPRQIGEYALVGRLGAGAMGAVYLGRSMGGRPVAVKVVHAGLADDPRFRERFRREVEMARTVGGFWTAAVVDADADAPQPWFATEYVPGPTLHEAVERHGALPVPTVFRLAAGLAEALRAVHAVGLVHRDVKPSNVLMGVNGPRLIDFGISRALDHSSLTRAGSVFGTPGYTAPEQLAGAGAVPASDVFALGAVLVFAATGVGPFGVGEPAQLIRRAALAHADLTATPIELRPVVEACLRLDPQARPSPTDLLAQVAARARPDEACLPIPVRALVADRATALAAVADRRPPTKVYTRVAAPPVASDHGSPVPGPRPPIDGSEPGESGQVVVGSQRRWPALWAVVWLLVLGWAAELTTLPDPGTQLVGGVLLVIAVVQSIRFVIGALRRPVQLEINASGVTVSRGRDRQHVSWASIPRVGVAGAPRRPHVLVWVREGSAELRFRRRHGGYRVYRVGAYRTARARSAEVRAVRAALDWYARERHDRQL